MVGWRNGGKERGRKGGKKGGKERGLEGGKGLLSLFPTAWLWLHFNLSRVDHPKVWWRFACLYTMLPYLLCVLVSPGASEEEKFRVAWSVFHGCAHCRDRAFTEKVRCLFPGPRSLLADSEFLQCIECWATNAKLGNMWIERLFALIRSASPDKHATAERVMSVGALSQWMSSHTASGGKNGLKYDRQRLVEEGVPLYSATAAERKKKKGRPTRQVNMIYAHAMMEEENRRRKFMREPPLERTLMYTLRKEFCSSWKYLGAAEKEEFKRIHCNVAPGAEVGRLLPATENKSLCETRDREALWGVNTDDQPIALDVFRTEVHKEVGVSDDPSLLVGFSRYSEAFRKAFQQRTVHRDQKDIPEESKLPRHFTCWEAHAGLCVTDDRHLARTILAIARGLRRWAWTEGTNGCFYIVRAELPPGPWLQTAPAMIVVCLAFKRGSDPEIAVFAQAAFVGKPPTGASLCFEPCRDGKEVIFETDCSVVKRLMAAAVVTPKRVVVELLQTKNSRYSAHRVRLCLEMQTGDEMDEPDPAVEVWPQRVKKAAPIAKAKAKAKAKRKNPHPTGGCISYKPPLPPLPEEMAPAVRTRKRITKIRKSTSSKKSANKGKRTTSKRNAKRTGTEKRRVEPAARKRKADGPEGQGKKECKRRRTGDEKKEQATIVVHDSDEEKHEEGRCGDGDYWFCSRCPDMGRLRCTVQEHLREKHPGKDIRYLANIGAGPLGSSGGGGEEGEEEEKEKEENTEEEEEEEEEEKDEEQKEETDGSACDDEPDSDGDEDTGDGDVSDASDSDSKIDRSLAAFREQATLRELGKGRGKGRGRGRGRGEGRGRGRGMGGTGGSTTTTTTIIARDGDATNQEGNPTVRQDLGTGWIKISVHLSPTTTTEPLVAYECKACGKLSNLPEPHSCIGITTAGCGGSVRSKEGNSGAAKSNGSVNVAVAAPAPWNPWALVRSRAPCSCCATPCGRKAIIRCFEFRIVHQAHRGTWKKYFHIDSTCLDGCANLPGKVESFMLDAAPMPFSSGERRWEKAQKEVDAQNQLRGVLAEIAARRRGNLHLSSSISSAIIINLIY